MRYALILSLVLFCTKAHAQVIYGDTPEQKKTGIYETVWLIRTDAGTGEVIQKPIVEKQDPDIKVKSCVQIDEGVCVESEYFKATIKDITRG
jgi:hypothetical protein